MATATTVFGIVAAIPQCISSAKDLYDLRSRYKGASVLITAIYSESMVIAASLSQLQNLLQQDALKNKPQLHETFDRALTGCRVVYVCLDEEVRELAQKAENDNLKFKERTKYLLKEDTFKELLSQIRGQQSALSLLLQGLQMESVADIKKLVQENSARLDQIATRSNTLRKSRPHSRVPDSIFNGGSDSQSIVDAEAILRSVEFDFDDEILDSNPYRKAMAVVTVRADGEKPFTTEHITSDNIDDQEQKILGTGVIVAQLEPKSTPAADETHTELLDSLEHSLLPFMPPSAVSVVSGTQSPASPYILSLRTDSMEEMPPPLPPRRSTQALVESNTPEIANKAKDSSILDDSISMATAPSIFSKKSTVSSHTTFESSLNTMFASEILQRKQPAVTQRTSYETLFKTLSDNPEDVSLASSDDVEMHSLWTSLIAREQMFVDRMARFRTVFYDPVTKQWPVLEKHLELIPMGEQLAVLHRQHLLNPIEEQLAKKSFATCDPVVFEAWASKVNKSYREYCQRLPHAKGVILVTQMMDSKFTPFLETLDSDRTFSGKSWEDYFMLPVSQLEVYVETMRRLHKFTLISATPLVKKNESRLIRALEVVRRLKKSCLRLIDEARDREEIQDLHRRVHTLNADYLSQLNLSRPGRRIVSQGVLARKVHGQGPWQAVHVVLLDNYLFWGMVKPPRSKKNQDPKAAKKVNNIWLLEAPIPLHEVVIRLPDKDHLFQKATILDDIPRNSVLYPLFVKDKTSTANPHMLGAYHLKEIEQWTANLQSAIARHAETFPTFG